jgi:hypothetical protein
MKRYIILSLFGMILLQGCKKEDKTTPPLAGYFQLTQIGNIGVKSTQRIVGDSIITEFQLGDLKNSREFFFLLSNGGDNPIFDVTLNTDNPQFIPTPSAISNLPGKNVTGSSAIMPLLSLGIIHGTQLNGVGYAELLPMNENATMLTIQGKTLENNDTIHLRSDFTFKVNAKIMDIGVFENDQEINLLNPRGAVAGMSNFGGLGFIRYYEVASGAIQLKNSGNVEIGLKVTEIDDQGNLLPHDPVIVSPDQTISVSLNPHFTVLCLDSEGTITNNDRIQLGDDGNGYLAFLKAAALW